jgi:hypothetical protein
MEPNTVQVRNAKDMTTDERETAKLEALAFLADALENNENYIIAKFHGDMETGSVALDGNASPTQLLLASKVIAFQVVLGTSDDPQATLDAYLAGDVEEAA